MEITYEDFEPFCKWKREQNSDTLEIELPGKVFIYIYFLYLYLSIKNRCKRFQ